MGTSESAVTRRTQIPKKPNTMKKILLALAITAGLTSFAGSAKAGQTFNWYFTGAYSYSYPFGSGYKDTIQGTLTLDDNGVASELYVTSDVGGNMTVAPFNFASSATFNQFQVANIAGVATVTNADFWSVNGNFELRLNHYDGARYYNTVYREGSNQASAANTANVSNFSATTYTAAVPEPSTYALFGIGALALIIAYRRKVA
jgi:hypothetical protein